MPYVENNGPRIHYHVEGEGPPLVLVHGTSLSMRQWFDAGFKPEYADELVNDYRLIMIDLRCHGRSAKLHDPESASPRLMAEDVIRVLDALGVDKAHYWGHSLGGLVGYHAAAFAPDRLRSLVLGGAHAFAESGEGLRRLFSAENPPAAVVGAFEMMDSMPPQLKSMVEDNDFQALCATVAIDRPDISDVLPHLTMPCLIYVGDADGRFEGAKESASRVPNATFFSLPGLNHLESLTHSALVIPRVKQFLAEVSQP